MTKQKVFIVDDEEDAISSVLILLKEFYQDRLEVAGFAQTIDEAEKALKSQDIDLLFLDIDLGEGTGFDLLNRIEDRAFEVIFVTAYQEYALDAIRAHALAYLLKPVNLGEFQEVVATAVDKIAQRSYSNVQPLLDRFQPTSDKIGVPVTHGTEFIDKTDILWVKADGSYSRIHRKDQKPLTISRKLKRFEEVLGSNDFLRIHNSVLININEIARFDRLHGEKVVMSDGTELPVSRKYKTTLSQVLGAWERL